MDDRERLAGQEWLKRAEKPTSVLPKIKKNQTSCSHLEVGPYRALHVLGEHAHGLMGEEELNRLGLIGMPPSTAITASSPTSR